MPRWRALGLVDGEPTRRVGERGRQHLEAGVLRPGRRTDLPQCHRDRSRRSTPRCGVPWPPRWSTSWRLTSSAPAVDATADGVARHSSPSPTSAPSSSPARRQTTSGPGGTRHAPGADGASADRRRRPRRSDPGVARCRSRSRRCDRRFRRRRHRRARRAVDGGARSGDARRRHAGRRWRPPAAATSGTRCWRRTCRPTPRRTPPTRSVRTCTSRRSAVRSSASTARSPRRRPRRSACCRSRRSPGPRSHRRRPGAQATTLADGVTVQLSTCDPGTAPDADPHARRGIGAGRPPDRPPSRV